MKTLYFIILSFLTFVFGCINEQVEENIKLKQQIEKFKAITGPPPSSLEYLYPPKSDGPFYQIMMFDLAKPFTAIGIDMFEKNLKQAKENFDKFRSQYIEVSKTVPEWEEAYPLEPIEELGTALSTGEQEKVMMAMGKVAKICQDCHIVNMPKVQQKFHWDEFSDIYVTDPVTNQEMGYKQHMLSLETSFQGIELNLKRGKMEKALKYFDSFYERFGSMKETCNICHETERKYYVDTNLEEVLKKLKENLGSTAPDVKSISELTREIGTESCFKCHLTHIPAVYNKARWRDELKVKGE
jgi:cytochrome c5